MKKFIINFATTALLFFYFFNFNINVASAQKIVCEIKKDQHGGEVFLFITTTKDIFGSTYLQ